MPYNTQPVSTGVVVEDHPFRLEERGVITHAEAVVLAHMREWCHSFDDCEMCMLTMRASRAERELDRVISG